MGIEPAKEIPVQVCRTNLNDLRFLPLLGLILFSLQVRYKNKHGNQGKM